MAQSTPYTNPNATGSNGNAYAGGAYDASFGASSASDTDTSSGFGGSMNPLSALSRHLGELSHETMTLLRQEVELAKAEGRDTAKHVGAGVGEIAVGGGVAMCGCLVLLGASVAGLSNVWPVWAAALVVGSVTLVGGLILASRARAHLNADALRPTETLGAARDTTHRVKESFR